MKFCQNIAFFLLVLSTSPIHAAPRAPLVVGPNGLPQQLQSADTLTPTGGMPYLTSSSVKGFSGNKLVNFFNAALQHNGHKTILFVGNSTVQFAYDYYYEMCTAFTTNNILSVIGLNPCSTDVAGYEVLNGTGLARVTFNAAVPSGYTVGDLILSLPTGNTFNTIVGTGVITNINIGAKTITYQMFSLQPFPAAPIAYSANAGLVSNSIVDLGQNGGTAQTINTAVIPIIQQYAQAGDLVLPRGYLINNVAPGICDLACATALVVSSYNQIVAAVPPTTDIAWKTENSFLTTLPPDAPTSKIRTAILRNAVFQAFASIPSRAVVWDTMQIVYTKLGSELASDLWMGDAVHPNNIPFIREAASDIQILTSIGSGNGLPSATAINDPYLNTGTNGSGAAILGGTKQWIDNLKVLVGFSSTMEEHALANNYGAPWTLYPDVVLDDEKYDIIAVGSITNLVSTSAIEYDFPAVLGGSPQEVQAGDLVWLAGGGVFVVPVGFGQGQYNGGGTVAGYYLNSLGVVVPVSTYSKQPVVVARQKSYLLADIPYYYDKATFPYRHRITVPAGGVNTIDVQFTDETPSWPNGLNTSSKLLLPCSATAIDLSGATFALTSTYTRITGITGSFAACVNQNGWVFGTQALEVNGSLVESSGDIVGGGNITIPLALLNTSAVPTLSSCGTTTPSVAAGSTNQGGQFTTGGTTGTACTVTFANAYPTYAFCAISNASVSAGTPYISASSATGFTVTTTVDGKTYNYACNGN